MKHTYSLWVTPTPDISHILQGVIDNLASEFDAPVFQPHMTLLGDISGKEDEVLEKAVLLSADLEPFLIELGEISFSTTYFQNIFVRIKSGAPLMNANLEAKEIYSFENNVFMPHMSLLYGDHDMEVREKIASRVRIPKGLSFTADTLTLVPNTPVTSGWKPIAHIGLSK